MTADHQDDDQNAEIVPLRPDAGPENLPAVPGDVPAEAGQAAGARPAIYADITGQAGERRDIIPAAFHRGNLRGTVATFAGLQWHRARYHGLRLPFYLLAVVVFAIIGLARLAAAQVHWWWLLEQHELRSDAAAAGDAREWRSLHKEAKQPRKVRGWLLAGEVAVLAVAALLARRYADIFASVPFGTDPRMRPVAVPVFEVNYLIGASPGQGKTAAVRALVSGVALDPVADLWVHEHAGKGDLEPFARVCHRYVSGLDDDAIAYAAGSAQLLKAELERRSALFKKLPKELRPEGKLTRELAMKYLRLRPIVVVFDEAQNVFMHPEHGEQAARDLADVMRLGRAYGIVIVLATQRPDSGSVPTAISGVVTGRFCLKVPDQLSNDMVLGTGAYKAGYNAAIFRLKTDAGLGWLKADGEPQVVRTCYLDLPATGKIAARARLLREQAGVLSGYALGLDDEDRPAPRDVLANVLAVIGTGNGLHWAPLADKLAERFPDRWADATAEAVSAQCRAQGLPSVDVKVDGYTTKGARRVLVERAMRQR